jgi:predicted transcriptional regulator
MKSINQNTLSGKDQSLLPSYQTQNLDDSSSQSEASDHLSDQRNRGFYIVDNEIIDEHGKHIGPLGVAIYNVLVKHANKAGVSCFPSYQTIADLLGISRNTAMKGVDMLVERGLIGKEARTNKSGAPTSNDYTILCVEKQSKQQKIGVVQNLDRGSANSALPLVQNLDRGSANSAPEQDPINKTQLNHTQQQNSLRAVGAPDVVVCSNSKFSLEDCQRYAKHLHASGQGVTNPGGFARTIHKSGMEDSQIVSWLAEVEPERVHSGELEAPLLIDASACTVCRGSKFFYPDADLTKGVRRCTHPALRQGAA